MWNKFIFQFPLILLMMLIFGSASLADARRASAVSSPKPLVFQSALPGYRYQFPKDHSAHRAFKTEWWYYNGHLRVVPKAGQSVAKPSKPKSRMFGYQLTFFRSGLNLKNPPLKSRWALHELHAAHFAISDEANRQFWSSEKLNRAHPAIASAATDRYDVRNNHWRAVLTPAGIHHLTAREGDNQIDLMLVPSKPPTIHGVNGASQKADCVGCASHYYSLTRMKTTGTLKIKGASFPVVGDSWMDHEFGSNQLTAKQTGWDWFSIQLSDGTDWMFYQLRQGNKVDPNSSGTVTGGSGGSQHFKKSDFQLTITRYWKSPQSGGRYPVGWRLSVPSKKLALQILPVFDHQELMTEGSTGVAYWEGRCKVSGTHQGKVVSGNAYVEMTGYAKAFQQKI